LLLPINRDRNDHNIEVTMDRAFVEEMRKRVEKELNEKELAAIHFWKEELEKLLKKPAESLSALQVELKNLIARMENRLKALKKTGM
jgi:hypothetical protein